MLTPKDEKLLKLAEMRLNGESDVFLSDEIEDLREEFLSELKKATGNVENVQSLVSELIDEVKKKDSELIIELDPEEIRGEPGKPGLKGKDGKNGKDGVNGKDGHSPIAGIDYLLPEKGEIGPIGPVGERGPMPKHEWSGTKVRFENPDGTWGKWVDIRGPSGRSIFGGGGGSSSVKIQEEGIDVTQSAQNINFTGSGVTVSQTGQTTTVNIPGGSGGISESLAIAYAVVL